MHSPHLLAPFRRVLVAVAVLSVAVNLLLFTSPIYMLQIYDRVVVSRSGPTLIALTVIVAFLLAIAALLEFIRSRILIRASHEFNVASQERIAARSLELKATNPSLANSLQSDADVVRDFVAGNGFVVFLDAPWAPLFVIVCFLIHPLIGAVALAGALAICALTVIYERKTRSTLQDLSAATARERSELRQMLAAHEMLRANGMTAAAIGRWIRMRGTIAEPQMGTADRTGTYATLAKFLRMLLQSAILGVGAWLAIHDEMSAGAIFAASLMMGRALAPVEQAVAQYKLFLSARAAYGRLSRALAPEEPLPKVSLPAPKAAVSIEGGTVFAGQQPILKRATLTVSSGEIVAVIGPSRSGKSTLLRALAGAVPLGEGSVRFDGYRTQEYDAETLGRAVGYLPQRVDLMDGTVAENIGRLASPEWLATEEGSQQVLAAATASGIVEMVARLPSGYETRLGEGCVQLSVGQAQRIGLARALFGPPRFLLLDEPYASLDDQGKVAFFAAILKAKQAGATTVMSLHGDIPAFVDRVVIMQDGAIGRMATIAELRQERDRRTAKLAPVN